MYRLSGLCLVCSLVLFPGALHGQVNTERMRALDVEGVRVRFGGDVALQSGTVDLFEVGANARLDLRRSPHYGFLVGDVRYGTKDERRFRDRTFGHLRYNYRLSPWLVGEAFTQLERDGFAELQLRTLIGGGLRVQYVDLERFSVFQGTTPMWESENLDAGRVGQHPASMSTVRWSNYLNVRFIATETTHVAATVYVQPRVDKIRDVRVLNQVVMAVALTEHVRVTLEFNLDYDSRPPDTVEEIDLRLSNGLQVSF